MIQMNRAWNVEGPNHYGRPFVRIQYDDSQVSSLYSKHVNRQLGDSPFSGYSEPLLQISLKLVTDSNRLGLIDMAFEQKNGQKYMLYFGANYSQALNLFQTGSYILERICSNPDTNLSYVIDEIFAPVHESKRPSVMGVTGTNGKTTVVNLIYQMLLKCSNSELKVGKIDSINVEINNVPVGGITDEQYDSGRMLLSLDLDSAVLELTRKGIWFYGLPTKNLSTGIITNVSNDHIGTYGISTIDDLLSVKSVVAANARNVIVLNHDDERLKKLSIKGSGAKVIYFCSTPSHEISSYDNAVYVDDGKIIIKEGGSKIEVSRLQDISFCDGGKIIHNVENILAALSAVYFDPNINIDIRKVSQYIETLHTNDLVPGRFNVFKINGTKIVVDYAHNPDGIRKLGASLEKIAGKDLSCLVTIAENRDQYFCEQTALELCRYFKTIFLFRDTESYSNDNRITILDLENSLRKHDQNSHVEILSKDPLTEYLDLLKTDEVGVVMFAGLGTPISIIERIKNYSRRFDR